MEYTAVDEAGEGPDLDITFCQLAQIFGSGRFANGIQVTKRSKKEREDVRLSLALLHNRHCGRAGHLRRTAKAPDHHCSTAIRTSA